MSLMARTRTLAPWALSAIGMIAFIAMGMPVEPFYDGVRTVTGLFV